MSIAPALLVESHLRPAPDHRPAVISWQHTPEILAHAPLPLVDTPSCAVAGADPLDEHTRGQLSAVCAAIIDTVAGRRAPQQLVRWVDERALAEIVLRARQQRRLGRSVGVRSQRFQRNDDRVEAVLRISDGNRSEAVALRFDQLGRRWMCLVADFGPTVQPRVV
ncbi:hypothetical protein CGZ93_13740 [Enemella dayhoffiae]|uniref:Uncharacterized protein n=1 Tax=Enemella dayhoffiae TaxID=2016507 RepID=A0A255GX21_9ACTN|nr:Rv3235 family protein [Enemella dayhoffiae]OYO19413.1 hypothetical protein CGZ93_13740 [Enemella dayhoffiae]